jgi:protoheme IX farnesyltransferase
VAQAAPYNAAAARTAARSRGADFVSLTKPRLNTLVLITSAAAYLLGDGHLLPWAHFVHMLIGTALVAGGASALNQLWERDTDRLMRRTRLRALPDARLHPQDAMWFGIALSAVGIAQLSLFVNTLTAVIAALTLFSYVLLYTPLKTRTSLSTIVGAVPGALPALLGWAAATNSASAGGWILFGIVFMWQMPHFLAIAWLFRDDYANAGIPLLPVVEPDGRSTGRQTVLYTAGLVPISLLPVAVSMATAYYLVGALALGAVLMVLSLEFASSRSTAAARRLFYGTILYLPLLWVALLTDHFMHL